MVCTKGNPVGLRDDGITVAWLGPKRDPKSREPREKPIPEPTPEAIPSLKICPVVGAGAGEGRDGGVGRKGAIVYGGAV